MKSYKTMPKVALNGLGSDFLQLTIKDAWASYVREGLLRGAEIYGVELFDKPDDAAARKLKYDGEIIVAAGDMDYIKCIHDVPITLPRVIINRIPQPEHKITSISIDQRIGAFKATQALLAMGHRRIAIDCEGDKTQPGVQRMQGYYDAYKAAGIAVNKAMALDYPPRSKSAMTCIRTMIEQEKPTAFILGNCDLIEDFLALLHSLGMRIPQDVSLIMFDDSMELRMPDLEVSVVLQPLEQITMEGVRVIKQLIEGEKDFHKNILMAPELLIRDSIAAVKTS